MRFFFSAIASLAVASVLIVAENFVAAAYFPHLARFTTDFSPAYLQRELAFIAAAPPQTIFLGDSVLWGYRLNGDQTAVAILRAHGCACTNLAFKSGNPANDYFLARELLASGVRPRIVVMDVNQAVLNESDAYYNTLHPALATVANSFLTASDRARLALPAPDHGMAQRVDGALASISPLYAMRSDIRETLQGDDVQAPTLRLTPDLFEGTYDLIPLDEKNVGVHYLEKTVGLLHRSGIPVLAFLTPTNHGLLHNYIDNSHYRANLAFLARSLQRRGACVLNLDDAFPTDEFLDNAHLTVAGQQRLASRLAQALGRYAN